MPRYFTHLVDGTDVLLDPDGVELPAETLVAATLKQALDCMAGDVHHGFLDLGFHLEVYDESGALVHYLTFSDALEIRRQSDTDRSTNIAA